MFVVAALVNYFGCLASAAAAAAGVYVDSAAPCCTCSLLCFCSPCILNNFMFVVAALVDLDQCCFFFFGLLLMA